MAKKTTLGPMATPGRTYIFTAKTAVLVVSEIWKAVGADDVTWKIVGTSGNTWKIIK